MFLYLTKKIFGYFYFQLYEKNHMVPPMIFFKIATYIRTDNNCLPKQDCHHNVTSFIFIFRYFQTAVIKFAQG